jgi:Flp pilus assembly pilin Flp
MKLEYALLLALVCGALLSGLHTVGERLAATYETSAQVMTAGGETTTQAATQAVSRNKP